MPGGTELTPVPYECWCDVVTDSNLKSIDYHNFFFYLRLGFDSIQGLEVNRLKINFGQINRLIDYM
jgi:hypothetical protein